VDFLGVVAFQVGDLPVAVSQVGALPVAAFPVEGVVFRAVVALAAVAPVVRGA